MNLFSPYSNHLSYVLPEFKDFDSYDLIIVGAGLAGCSAAYHATQNGMKTLIIEKNHIGSGQTGLSGGQFIPGFEVDLESMFDKYGKSDTKKLFNQSLTGFQELKNIVGADLFFSSGFVLSTTDSDNDFLLQEKENYQSIFIDSHFVDRSDLSSFIHSDIYTAGLELPFVQHANPLQVCYELLNKSNHHLLNIIENSEVLKINNESVYLKNNQYKSKHIFLAGGNSIALFYTLFRPTVWVKTWSIATEILTAEKQNSIIPKNHCFFDSRESTMDYFRINENRLLFGGGDAIASSHERGLDYLNKRIKEVFPSLENTKIEYSWGQYVDVSSSRMPIIENKNNIWLACGYSGQGLINSYCSGKWMVYDLLAKSSDWNLLKNFYHLSFPSFKPFTYLGGNIGANLLKIFEN